MKVKINWDRLGITTSVVCAIHCGLLPVILPVLPLFGVNIVHNSLFEWAMIALAFGVGCYSLYHGFIRHHHSYRPITIFLIGFIFLVLKQFFHSQEYIFLSIAVPLIISAHFINIRLCKKNKCSSAHHVH